MDEFNENGIDEEKASETLFEEPTETVNETAEPETVEAEKIEPEQNHFNYSANNGQFNGYSYGNPNSNPNMGYNPNGYNMNGQGNFNAPKPPKKKNKGVIIICVILVAALIITGTVVGISLLGYNNVKGQSSAGNEISADNGEEITGTDGGEVIVEAKKEKGALTTIEIAEIAKKSSVGVVVYSKSTSNSYFSNNGTTGGDTQSGEGTGVIISLDNQGEYTYIVTCAHVISDKNISVKILLEDGTTYDAEIVGYDAQTDIGLLRTKTTKLQKYAATIGDSSKLQVGQSVFAIGNPGGSEFFGSFTSGVVSAIGRSLSSETGYTLECIQHDAAINPGNSGGGLLNAQGQLIGINSSKIASTEYEGMSFAIPINNAVEVVNALSSHGYVPNRPKLGISYALATNYNQGYAMVVQLKGLPSGSLIIASISKDSGLANTDAQVGDIITSVNGKNLDKADVLLEMIENGKVGDNLKLGITRIGSDYSIKEFTVDVKLVEDKGGSSSDEQETTTAQFDPFSYFFGN